MAEIYTHEQWAADRNFAAADGQEITEEIYFEMFECLPPKRLKDSKGCFSGFRMGEPHTHGANGPLYMAFGKRGDKYYYLGLQ